MAFLTRLKAISHRQNFIQTRKYARRHDGSPNFIDIYMAKVASGELERDEDQLAVLGRIQQIENQLVAAHNKGRGMLSLIGKRKSYVRGLYLHGPAGSGKSTLLEIFYQASALNPSAKKLEDFYEFTEDVCSDDMCSGNTESWEPPERFKNIQVLFVNGFGVMDYAHCLILKKALERIFSLGVTLVTSSDRSPYDLRSRDEAHEVYKPIADMLNSKCHVIPLSTKDFRAIRFPKPKYYFLTKENAEAKINDLFSTLAKVENDDIKPRTLIKRGHEVKLSKTCGGILDCTFEEVCNQDYIEIAKTFHTVIIRDIPQFDLAKKQEAMRFIRLIDVLYNLKRRVVCSSEVALENLFAMDGQQKEIDESTVTDTGQEREAQSSTDVLRHFHRIKSRIKEMQSDQYVGTHSAFGEYSKKSNL